MTTLALDIGGTKLAAATVERDVLSMRRACPTPSSQTPGALEEALRALVLPLVRHAGRVAVASTGIIHNGVLTSINPANFGWHGALSAGRLSGSCHAITGHGG